MSLTFLTGSSHISSCGLSLLVGNLPSLAFALVFLFHHLYTQRSYSSSEPLWVASYPELENGPWFQTRFIFPQTLDAKLVGFVAPGGWWTEVSRIGKGCFYASVSCMNRPIQWLDSSIITSHPSSPVVVGRSFPSASSFILPSPAPLLSNPSAYDPPSIIEVSSDGESVFAFFEGRGCEHVACIWNREVALGTWRVSIYWQMRPGQGIVLAKWLGNDQRTVCGHISMQRKIMSFYLLVSGYTAHRDGCLHWAPQTPLEILLSFS